MDKLSQLQNKLLVNGQFDQLYNELCPRSKDVNYTVINMMLIFMAYYHVSPEKFGANHIKMLKKIADKHPSYCVDVGLLYLNKGDNNQALKYLDIAIENEIDLAYFYKGIIFADKRFGMQDLSKATALLKLSAKKNICSWILLERLNYLSKVRGRGKYYNLYQKSKRIFDIVKYLQLVFLLIFKPDDSRLSSQGAFEYLGLNGSKILLHRLKDEKLASILGRIYFKGLNSVKANPVDFL